MTSKSKKIFDLERKKSFDLAMEKSIDLKVKTIFSVEVLEVNFAVQRSFYLDIEVLQFRS